MRSTVVPALLFVLVIPVLASAQVCTPTVLGTLATSGYLGAPEILGTSLYVPGRGAGLVWLDVADPAAPALRGTVATPGTAEAVVLEYFQRYLVVADGSAGIAVMNLGADGAPAVVQSGPVGGTAVTVAGSGGQWVVGTSEGQLVTVTADPGAAPEVQGTVEVGGPVRGIALGSRRAYVAAGPAGLVVVDLADRTAPAVITSLPLGGDVMAVVRDGTRLYAGVSGVGLVAIEVRGDELVRLASLVTPGDPVHLVTWVGRLYVAVPDSGVMVVDVSIGEALLELGSVEVTGARGLALVGDLLHVARGAEGYAAVDIGACATAGSNPVTRYIPAAARATGAANTYWVTDVAIANLTASPATCNVAYLVKNQANPVPANRSFVVGAGEQLLLGDVLSSAFGLDAGNGALRIVVSNQDLKVTSRTYNAAGAAGTYGQFIPALELADAVQPGVPGALPQLEQSDAFRTNVGLLNVTPLQVTAAVDLYGGGGALLGTVTVDLEPYEMVQLDRVFTRVTSAAVESGYAVVRVTTSDGKVLAYASVVDNGSGDPIYVPAQRLAPGTPFE